MAIGKQRDERFFLFIIVLLVDLDRRNVFTNLETNAKKCNYINWFVEVFFVQTKRVFPHLSRSIWQHSLHICKRLGFVDLVSSSLHLICSIHAVHTCDWITSEGSTTAGEEFYTATLDTAKGNFTIGSMICYDRENPEVINTIST